MTQAEWIAEGTRRFGADQMGWRFVCPSCHCEQSVQDYKSAGAPSAAVAFSCVGRWLPAPREAFSRDGVGPCNYAGGGLIGINPVVVEMADGSRRNVFAFAGQRAGYAASKMNRLSQAQIILREPVIHERRKGAATGGTVEFVIVSRKAWDAAKDLAYTAVALWSSQQEEQSNG